MSRGRKKKSTRRDPAWFGDVRGHAAAARKGWRTRSGSTTSRSKKRSTGPCGGERPTGSRGRRDPAWFGESERHSYAAEKGWRRVARPGWTPQRYNPKEFDGSARDQGPTRRRSGGNRNY